MTVDDETVEAAVAAVAAAARLTTAAQGRLLRGDTLTKGDDSPVTVADFGAQAVACAVLTEALGDVVVVGEEDPTDLSEGDGALLAGVESLVSAAMARDVGRDRILEWIGIGAASPSGRRYWTLDPIDGTKGFLRGDQYAIALGLVDDGAVVLGVLGCPNYPIGGDGRGLTLVAADGVTHEIIGGDRRPIRITDPPTLGEARLCESVESAHSDHDQATAIAALLGIATEPYRIDSQCKYAAIARSDAHVYLRLPTRADYREKIWDHAAGAAAVTLAGGTVTDVDGRPLDFSLGRRLSANRGIIATSGAYHDAVVEAVQYVLD